MATSRLRRVAVALREPVTPQRYVALTRAALWSLTIIVATGGAVRLTGSGLGCSDWPTCEEDQFAPEGSFHGWIEFGNRLFTGVVALAVIGAVLGSLRRMPRRPDLVRWSWGLVAGVLGQIVLGALLVRTDLDPRFTMGHYLLSMVLLWNAAVLMHRAQEPDDDGRAVTDDPRPAHAVLHRLVRAVSGLGAVLLVTGTIVTGSGPHSGSDEPEVAARLPFEVREVTRVHSLVAISLLVLVVAVIRRASGDGRIDVRSGAGVVAGLLVVQGTIGYVQYFNGVPELLVLIHLTLASITWIAIVRLHLRAVPRSVEVPAGVLVS